VVTGKANEGLEGESGKAYGKFEGSQVGDYSEPLYVLVLLALLQVSRLIRITLPIFLLLHVFFFFFVFLKFIVQIRGGNMSGD
jgi:hypothetical protein